MKSKYQRLGNYIEPCNAFNDNMEVKELLGISNQKYFQKSHTNTIGIDLTKYRIVRNNQFAFNRATTRNGDKISIALRNGSDCIVSPSYRIFRSKDENILNSEYLMMWFRRPEFDRYARFKSHGSAHEFFDMDEMNDVELPIPSLEKQQQLVNEYHTLQKRIDLNNQLIAKLEETAQTIYKQWFVEFEFPDENGKPYKSNGGKMVWCEELEKEIPDGWEFGKIGNLIDVINGYAFSSEDFVEYGDFPIVKITNIVSPDIDLTQAQYYSGNFDIRLMNCLVKQDDLLISMTGSHMNQINSAVGKIGRYNFEFSAFLNQRVGKLQPKKSCREFIFITMLQPNIQKEILMGATGSANQANISPNTIKDIDIIIPEETVLTSFEDVISKFRRFSSNYKKENQKLTELKDLLLGKMAKGELK